jgi:hypothetical protein
VGRDEQGLLEALQQADQFPAAPGVEARRRLVEDEDRGIHREDRRERDPLALTEREPMRDAALRAGHPDRREGPLDAIVDLVGRQAEVDRPERDVVEDGRAEELVVGILEDQADLGTDRLDGRPVHDAATDPDRPVPGREDPVELEHERTLARPVGTDERDLLAARDAQVQAAQRLEPVGVGEVEVLDLDPARREVGVVEVRHPRRVGDRRWWMIVDMDVIGPAIMAMAVLVGALRGLARAHSRGTATCAASSKATRATTARTDRTIAPRWIGGPGR